MLRKSLIVIAWIVVVLVGSLLLSRSSQSRVMKDGKRLYLNNFTFTKNVKIDVRDDDVTLYSQFWEWIRGRPISKRYHTVRNEQWGQPQPAVWLEIERKKGQNFRARQLRAEIHMPNGQILGSRFFAGSEFVPYRDVYNADLPALPTTLKDLDLRIVVDDESFQFNVQNPAYQPSPEPVATQTLPYTEARGNLTATLDGFDVKLLKEERRNELGFNLAPIPKFHLWWNGSPADDWYDKQTLFANAEGVFRRYGWVFGEPYWKVRITVRRNAKFPLSDDDLMRFEPLECSLGSGEIRELVVPVALQETWPRAVFLGPGSYSLTAQGPVRCEIDPVTHLNKGQLFTDIDCRNVALLLIGPEPTKTIREIGKMSTFGIFVRDDRNDVIRFENKSVSKQAGRLFKLIELYPGPHSKSLQISLYDLAEETFEYTVTPPPLPAIK